MLKFTQVFESIEKKYLGWSAQDILVELQTIENFKAAYLNSQFICKEHVSDGDYDDFVTLSNIEHGSYNNGSNVIELHDDVQYSPYFTFKLFSYKAKSNYNHETEGVQSLIWLDDHVSIDYLVGSYKNIQDVTDTFKNDFYVFIDMGSTNFGGTGEIFLTFVMKDKLDKSQII